MCSYLIMERFEPKVVVHALTLAKTRVFIDIVM